MRFPLRLKLALIYLAVAAAGFLVMAVPATRLMRQSTEDQVISALYKDANYLAASYRVNTGAVNQGELEAMAYASHSSVWIIAEDGEVQASAGDRTAPAAVPAFDPRSGVGHYYMEGDFYGTFREDMLSVYAPLTSGVRTRGYVIVHYPMTLLSQETDRKLGFSYVTYMVMLVLLLIAFILFDIFFIRPLKKVQQAAMEYADRNLSYPSDVRTHDEIGALSDNLEEIARQLVSSADDQHRFLANISHDFRSPLTSIRGYMVAMQDGTIPPEMQGKYLDVVINETDRLTKLANSLLDVTQLENGVILDRSDFDLNQLIREVLLSFEGRVEEKRIVFNVTFEEESCYVNADRARIQQVIYNLVDNAIKFSEYDSAIDLSTSLHGDKVLTSVADHGVGIEKENLPKIWDRFYKTDSSRGKDKKGTGLGLSIVREIIQAHRENIDVISTPGVGTEFIFSLPSI